MAAVTSNIMPGDNVEWSIIGNLGTALILTCPCCRLDADYFLPPIMTDESTEPVRLVCTKPDFPDESANTFIWTRATPLPEFGLHVDAAKNTTAQGKQKLQDVHPSGANLFDRAAESGSSGIFFVLFLLALGSTLWYRRKYLHALTTSQQGTAANKTKVN